MTELDLIGQQARSREGRGFAVKGGVGDSDKWITIQQNTFTNWVNLQLQGTELHVEDLHTDLCDGVKLCVLVESLQKKRVGRVIKKPMNQHQFLENVSLALNAIAQDNVKLVNIGSEDIVNSNKKLILGLIWHLILRYQIGKTKMPPKKLMLAWLHAVIPDCRINNFTSDWNDGVSLHALIDYCQPGLCSNWRSLSANNRLENCRDAMMLAKNHFGIPLIVRPEDFSSPHLDELSGMTYLSYYMNVDSPGYNATKRNINALLAGSPVDNFTTDWNDGRMLCQLVKNLGGRVRGWPNLSNNPEDNINSGIEGAQGLGVEPILSAKEMSEAEVEHLGIMAYAAYFTRLTPVKSLAEKAVIDGDFTNVYVGQTKSFRLNIDDDVQSSDFRAEVIGPDSLPAVHLNWSGQTAHATFTPSETGQHRLNVYCTNDPIAGCPVNFRVSSDRSKVTFHPVDRCIVGHPTELKVDISAAGQGDVRMESRAPGGRSVNLPVTYRQGVYSANFTPSEVGDHLISVHYDGDHINGSPFTVKAFDPNAVRVYGLEGGSVGRALAFSVDSSQAGEGELRVAVSHDGASIPCHTAPGGAGLHSVQFTPQGAGLYKIDVFFNEVEVRGLDWSVEILDESSKALVSSDTNPALSLNAKEDNSVPAQCVAASVIQSALYARDEKCLSAIMESSSGELEAFSESEAVVVETVLPVGGAHVSVIKEPDEDESGSPYTLEIVDSSLVTVSGDGLSLVPVNRSAVFSVHTRGAGAGNIAVEITSPSGEAVSAQLLQDDEGNYNIKYSPVEAGDYKISLSFMGEPLKGSPFTVKAFDPGKVVISHMPSHSFLGTAVSFQIDASRAGSGNIEIRVNDGRVSCSVVNNGNHCFTASYVPEVAETHVVALTFNDEPVQGSPWRVEVFDVQEVSVKDVGAVRYVQVNKPAEFAVSTHRVPSSHFQVTVTAPSGSNVPVDVENVGSDELRVQYIPRVVGDHEVHVRCGAVEANGSPFTAKAYDAHAIIVSPLHDGFVNRPIKFTIDVRQAGEGQLQIMVNNGNLPNEVELPEPGVYEISFIPVEAGRHEVEISFNDETLPCCPMSCAIIDPSAEVIQLQPLQQVEQETEFLIKTRGAHEANVTANCFITSPSGQNIPVRISGTSVYGYTVEYTPREIGTYAVQASLAGVPIKGSPFKVKSFDPSQVKVSQIPKGVVGTPCKFIIDASTAGEGTLEIAVSANGRNIPNQARALGGGRFEVTFVGRQAIGHRATIKYNGLSVPGSPFQIDFMDASQISASGEGLSLVPCHRHTHFNMHAPGATLTDFNITITAPDGREVPVRVKDKGDNNFRVEWMPTSVGDHQAIIQYADMPIQGSPFTVKAFDISSVRVSTIGQGFLGRPVSFTLDASEAGDGNLEIHVVAEGDSVPNYVKQETDTLFRVTFTPQRACIHQVQIRFNGEPVPGSPFPCRVIDSDLITVTGDGLKMVPANMLASFKVDPHGVGEGELAIKVFTPSGYEVPVRVSGASHSSYRVDYTPAEIGMYRVQVEYGGVEVKGSPFSTNVYDPRLVKVHSPGRAYLGKPIHFQIDTSAAGIGELAADVKCRGSSVNSQIRETGRGRYELTFTPRELSTHIVTIFFNQYPLPGSPYPVDVVDSSSVTMSGEGLTSSQVYRETWFNVDLHGMAEDDLDVHITSPSGHEIPCRLTCKGHVCRAEFTPVEVGPHQIDVLFAGSRLHGSPFISHAYDPSLVRITDVDRTAKKEREIAFTVDASAAGVGDLEAVVTHRGHVVPTHCEPVADGRYRYTFKPRDIGHYDVTVTFNDEQIPGCPLIINVEEEVPTFITISFRGNEPLHAKGKNYFVLHMDGKTIDMDELNVDIQAPNGDQVPARLLPQQDGNYKVEWTPAMAGRHTVDVSFAGQQIQGSPFYIEVFDINKIRVDHFYSGSVGDPAGFSVDMSDAGQADHNIQVMSPSGHNVATEIVENRVGEFTVTYTPSEMGPHKIYMSFGGLEFPGSPFIQEIGEGLLPTAHGEGLYHGEEDKPATFYIESSGMVGEPTVSVDGPNAVAKCSIDPQPDGRYSVTYIPVEVGMFDVQVLWNGRNIHSSPFHPKIVNPRKVRVVGGWQHYMDSQERVLLTVNKEKQIPFDCADAGPGKLHAEVKGPTGSVPCRVDDHNVGNSIVCFTPREEGKHQIHVHWADIPISNSPFLGYASSGTHDISKVILTGRGLKEAIVREEAEFIIDASQAGSGEPEVQLTGVKAEVSVVVTPLGGGKYRCTYIPTIPGAYLLHISWNGHQLRGSPYKVNVIGAFYPNKVIVGGEGLKGGLLGRDLDIRIDTRKAGPGELAAYCMGPNKAAYCELEDNHDGTYRLSVKPQETGRHILQVKYGGEHVQGSPFVFRVSAQPDASKVRVSGPGVEDGILATFQSRFIVETRGAGAGQLMVRIRGPKGAFQVEMYRDSQKDRTILCRYDPIECGLYIVNVKWSNVDVPGSPFHVHIVDTQAELEQCLQEASYNNTLPSYRSGYSSQWREDI